MRSIVCFVLLLLSVVHPAGLRAAPDPKDSPLVDEGVFRRNGFILDSIQPDRSNLILGDGLFRCSLRSTVDTELRVTILKRTDRALEAMAADTFLGVEGSNADIRKHWAMARRGKDFDLAFFVPDEKRYLIQIAGRTAGGGFSEMLEYRVSSRRPCDEGRRIDFLLDYVHGLLKSRDDSLFKEFHEHGNGYLTRLLDADGLTPFLKAVAEGDLETVRYLLDYDDDTDFKKDLVNGRKLNARGETALMLAVKNGRTEIVKALLAGNDVHYLRDPEGRTALDLARAGESRELVALLEALPAGPSTIAEERLLGEWEGYIANGNPTERGLSGVSSACWCRLTISRKADRLVADSLVTNCYDRKAVLASVSGGRPYARQDYPDQFAGRLEMDVYTNLDEVYLLGRKHDNLFQAGADPARTAPLPLYSLRGRLTESGLLLGHADVKKQDVFFLKRKDAGRPPVPAPVPKGKVSQLTCDLFPDIRYSVYLPTGYDPARPSPLLLLSLPSKAAVQPLLVKTAEQLGWISVGSNGLGGGHDSFCQLYILIDLMTRFHTADRRIYLAGFSATANENAIFASLLNEVIGGLIDAGGYSTTLPLDLGVPMFFIRGDRDGIWWGPEKFKKDIPGLKEKYGRLVECRLFPGGHEWYKPELLVEAMNWLNGR